MDVSEQAAQTTAAVLAQLNAEAIAHKYTVKSLAAELGIDYNTFRRYMSGERQIPNRVLYQTIDTFGMDLDLFMGRAADRLRRG